MKGFLYYQPGDTILHHMNPLAKLIMAVAICVGCFATGSLAMVAALILLSLGLGALGGIFRRAVRTLAAVAKFSSILFVLQIFFVREGAHLIDLPLGIYITDTGLRFSLLICLRLIGATLPLTIMLQLTQLSDLTGELVRLGMPYRYAFALTTAVRFIPVLSGEMGAIIEAQTARGVELDGNILRKIRLLVPLCVPLLVGCVQRIEGSAISAELRGFNLRTSKTGARRFRLQKFDLISLAICAIIVVACVLV